MRSKKNTLACKDDLFQLMADCAPVLLWVAQADSSCIFFNKAWLEFTGRTIEQEWGIGWTENIHFEDFQACVDSYVAHFTHRKSFEMEYRLRRHDGEYRWLLNKGVPYYDTEGNFLGFIGSGVDITESKKAELLLHKINEELEERVQTRTCALKESETALAVAKLKAEEASRMKSEFIATVSHELRTPMTAILGSLELLPQAIKYDHSEQSTQLIHVALQNTNRMLRLINNILDIEKIAAGKLGLHLKAQTLLPIIQKAIINNTLFAKQYHVEIKLGEILPDAKANVDEDRFLQVLDNLLSNAAKFSKSYTTVTITMRRQMGTVCIMVKDCGSGIPMEFESQIFTPFTQAPSTERRLGSGLGLNIAKSIIEQHQGSIRYETSPHGSTFFIELPEIT